MRRCVWRCVSGGVCEEVCVEVCVVMRSKLRDVLTVPEEVLVLLRRCVQ